MTELQTDQANEIDVNRLIALIVEKFGPLEIGVDTFKTMYADVPEDASLVFDVSEDQLRIIISRGDLVTKNDN